ncbi:MAG: hypothetical protein ACYDAG_05260 [Chloroflexota bacterium]
MRVGETFLAPEVAVGLGEEQDDEAGWSSATTKVKFPLDSGYVFVGTTARPNRPEWRVTAPLGRVINQQEGREALLRKWYVLAGLSLDNDLQQAAAVFGEGRRNPTAERFELALANICGACGLSTYFGGKVLTTPGVDLLAIDQLEGRIYAISVTTANAALEKYRKLKAIMPELIKVAGPHWAWQPVVASAQGLDAFVQLDLAAIAQDGGVVLTWETIQPLIGAATDISSFREALRPPPRGLPGFGQL